MADPQTPPEFKEPYRRGDGIPLPKSEQWRNWRKVENLTFGEQLLRKVDPELTTLTMDQQRQVVKFTGPESISALLQADLGDATNPDLTKAVEVFGNLAKQKFDIPDVILTLRFYCVAQLMKNIEDFREVASNTRLKAADRIEAQKCVETACEELHRVIGFIEKLANRLKLIGPKYRGKPKPAPRVATVGVAPDLE